MKKRQGIVFKLSLVSILLVLFSVVSILSVGYFVNYSRLETAAGEELVGCAAITTALIDAKDVEAFKKGEYANYDTVLEKVNWIVDHKPIFLNASILSTDGTVLVPDKRLELEGYKRGDKFYLDADAVQEMALMKHPTYSKIYSFGGHSRKTGYSPIFQDNNPSKEIIAYMAVDFDKSIISKRTMSMLSFTIMFGSAFPVLAGLFGFWYARRMARPILDVTDSMKRFSQGDLTLEPLPIRTQDEIGSLTETFNAMVGGIRQNMQDVASTAV